MVSKANGRQTVWAGRAGIFGVLALLTFFGPLAVRVEAVVPVVRPLVGSVARPDDAATQLQQQRLAGGAGNNLRVGVGERLLASLAQVHYRRFRLSTGQDGVDGAR